MSSLPVDDFRAHRDYLPDDAFALVEGGPDPELDRISLEAWRGVFALTDDVALRTTSFQGTIAEHCHDAWVALVYSFPQDRSDESPMFEALLDLADHLQAASFSALHGYYRQAFATLRSAEEQMIVTTRFALFDGLEALRSWRYDEATVIQIRPTADLDRLAGHTDVERLNEAMAPLALATGSGGHRTGWAWDVYQVLSKFAHVTPGYTDGELWKSNGPVWGPSTFVLYISMMRQVLAIAMLLARVGDPALELGDDLLGLLTVEGEEWVTSVRRGLVALGVELRKR
ncbi:MAG: hypothetical protein ACYCWW_15950 [Deltaproteobacteria bacterium]